MGQNFYKFCIINAIFRCLMFHRRQFFAEVGYIVCLYYKLLPLYKDYNFVLGRLTTKSAKVKSLKSVYILS